MEAKYLVVAAYIVKNNHFESAVVKLLSGKEKDMSATDKYAAYSCLLPTSDIIGSAYNGTEDLSEIYLFWPDRGKAAQIG